MTNDEANYLVERLKVLCADMTELLNQATEALGRIEQADTSQTESTGSPIGDYRDGVGAWQTDCGWGEPNE